MNKYKVKEGCAIEHAGVRYEEGAVIELDAALALHHAANIELVVSEPEQLEPSKPTRKKEDKADATGGS